MDMAVFRRAPRASKVCSRCQTDMPRTEFYRNSRATDGLKSWCRTCHHASLEKKRKSHTEEERARVNKIARDSKRRIKLRDIRHYKVRMLLIDARKRANANEAEFSIASDDLGDWRSLIVCPELGIPLEWDLPKASDDSPSIDRINNLLGYVPGNVRVISRRANRLKNDATDDELILMGENARKRKVASWT